jgi:hypothetical protein
MPHQLDSILKVELYYYYSSIVIYLRYNYGYYFIFITTLLLPYVLDDQPSIPGRGRVFFFWPLHPDRFWNLPSPLSNGYRWLFQWVKRPELESDHSYPSSAEIMNVWSYAATPPYVFVAW